jgi:hypothetical protein
MPGVIELQCTMPLAEHPALCFDISGLSVENLGTFLTDRRVERRLAAVLAADRGAFDATLDAPFFGRLEANGMLAGCV